MASNEQVTYNVDLVFCIDCTESMDNILNIVKERALNMYEDIRNKMAEKNKIINQLRVRLVGFRDYLAYDQELKKKVHPNEPMMVSDFFVLPQDAHKLQISVQSLHPIGGGDAPEDGLEALAYSIRSDWAVNTGKHRHIIVLWSDEEPHPLGFAKNTTRYPKGMARDLDELTSWWGEPGCPGYMPRQESKRMILFTPNEGGWRDIYNNWDYVISHPHKAGSGLKEMAYQQILDCIINTL